MIADDPVDLAVEHGLPQRLDVLARADRRIDLGVHGACAIGVEQKMADGHFAPEGDVRKDLLHGPGRFHRLARAQMQQVDVHAIGFVGEIGGDPDGEPFGMRRPRGAVGAQTRQLAFALDQRGVGVEDVGKLAVQADADVVARVPGDFSIDRRAARMMNSKCAMS